ncbi:DUF5067 domain-containing protein, partial [Listeria monocytogenes]|uniref:DUF5067 domain-containing protein n=1 Tax=Listeria monocytogenes TaxID=1639 RepID=UPI003A4E562D
KENISFMVAIDQQAFQNGTQLETTVSADASMGGSEKDVQPGGENPTAEHIPSTPLNIFETQLLEMIARLKKLDIKPILMTLPPL